MKRLIAIGTVLCALLLLSSCDNNARLQEGSSITVIEIGASVSLRYQRSKRVTSKAIHQIGRAHV